MFTPTFTSITFSPRVQTSLHLPQTMPLHQLSLSRRHPLCKLCLAVWCVPIKAWSLSLASLCLSTPYHMKVRQSVVWGWSLDKAWLLSARHKKQRVSRDRVQIHKLLHTKSILSQCQFDATANDGERAYVIIVVNRIFYEHAFNCLEHVGSFVPLSASGATVSVCCCERTHMLSFALCYGALVFFPFSSSVNLLLSPCLHSFFSCLPHFSPSFVSLPFISHSDSQPESQPDSQPTESSGSAPVTHAPIVMMSETVCPDIDEEHVPESGNVTPQPESRSRAREVGKLRSDSYAFFQQKRGACTSR